MIKCPFCQFDNEEGALFCEQCKSDLGATEPVATQPVEVSHALAEPKASALPRAVISEVMSPLAAVAVAEAAITEAVPVAQLDAGVAAAAEGPIAVAVPLPETQPLTVAPDVPGGIGVFSETAPAQSAVSTTPDTLSPIGPAQQEHAPSEAVTESPDRLPPAAKPKLVVVRGQRLNVEYPLYEGDNYLGRADEKAVDIDLEDQEPPDRIWSSRQHALITYGDGLLTIEDLNSTNGTFVNRARVHPGQKRPLQVNDVIQIGTVQMKVKI